MEHAKPLRPPGNQGMRAAAHFLPESRFIHPDEAAFVQGLYMTFLHGPAGGTGGGINVAADRFHILAHPAYRIAGNAPQKGSDTQNNQFAFHRFLAALLGSGGGRLRRSGGFLSVTVDTESESKGCYSEDLFHIMICEVVWCW